MNIPYKYSVSYFSAKNGMEDGLVNDMIQDRKGLLWFATWSGLYRFDGYNFKHYQSVVENNESLGNNRLLSIQEDKYGYLWISSYDSVTYRFHPDKEFFEPVAHPHMSESVHEIKVFPHGTVWIFYSGGRCLRVTTNPEDHSLGFYEPDWDRNIQVNSVFADSEGKEWILTNNGLYLFSGSTLSLVIPTPDRANEEIAFHSLLEKDHELILGSDSGRIFHYSRIDQTVIQEQLPSPATVVSIQELRDERVYVTDLDGLYFGNGNGIRHMGIHTLPGLTDPRILSAQTTENGLLWLTHPCPGVTWFNPSTRNLNYVVGKDENTNPLYTDTGFFTFEDTYGILWVHPKGGGLSYYDPEKDILVPFNTTDQAVKWKSNDRCFSAFSDKQGNLWISTQLNRLKRISFLSDKFQIYTPNPADIDLPENEIRALYIDKKGRIWSGSRDSYVSIYDTRFNLLSRFQAGRVYAITEDHEGNYWLSTKGDGLIKARETKEGHFQTTCYIHDANDPYSLNSDNVYYTFEDSKKRVWVATYGGGLHIAEKVPDGSLRFISAGNDWTDYPMSRFNKLRHITEDLQGNIWVSSTAGVLYIHGDFSSPGDIVFHPISHEQGNAGSLNYNDVHMITCTQDQRIFAATYGGGINEIIRTHNSSFHCIPFTHKDGLISDIIYSAEEDAEGYLWLVTAAGLIKFRDPQNQIFYPNDHLAFNMHFSEGVSASNGEFIISGTNRGILYFIPQKIKSSEFSPRIFLSSIWVNNEEQTPETLKGSLDNSTHIILPPNNHSLRLVFSALDMTDTEYIQYAYMLEGFDSYFRLTEGTREANYTNLPPGKYTFRVKSTNNEGVWMDNERLLSMEVLPAFRETMQARVLFAILSVGLFMTILYVFTVFYRMKEKVRNEELLAELKLNFFTNVSHELRTPLTLISGPLEVILEDKELPVKLQNSLAIIRKNCDRMQRLVGQILDFSKIQGNKMQLRIQHTEMVEFTREIVTYFTSLAEGRNIRLHFTTEVPEVYLWIDAEKIEKVIFNFLSNAFKYTPDHRAISVLISETQETVCIQITDQGVGIPKEKQQKIFERFENLAHKDQRALLSSGIGLSLAKEFMEMHQGTISLQSEAGKGSTFFIRFLKGKEHYAPDTEYILADLDMNNERCATPEKEIGQLHTATDQLRILIVEDNPELRNFIRQIFQEKYCIIEAQNGKQGLEKAFSHLPDMIITDIMMPVKNGLEMLQELRQDERTSHIPAIVLTAKADMDSILTGVRTGADDYITKPFSVSYLQEKVNSLLIRQRKIQEYFHTTHIRGKEVNKETFPAFSEKDVAFLSKLDEVMEQQMSNETLTIDDLVSHFTLSRTNFFHKVKSLTGVSPVTYIKEKRMQKAAMLVREKQYSISEIAYRVGYTDPNYFSKTFKSFWGMTATDYAKGEPGK
ncbi:MAG: response regulator [Bacteroides sp.]|nr:response regulator [Bacteroides sp.]